MTRRPPAFIESVVGWLLPLSRREHVLGDLSERYKSPGQYVIDALRTVPLVIVSQVRRTWDPIFAMVQACALFMSFEAAWRFANMPLLAEFPQLTRLLIPVAAGLAGLVLRDAYVEGKSRPPLHSIFDAAFGVAFAFLFEAVLAVLSPGLSLTGRVIGQASLIGLFILALVRMSLWIVARPKKEAVQGTYASTGSAELQQMTQFQRTIRSRNLREYAAAVFVVIAFGRIILLAPTTSARVWPALIIVVTLYMMYGLHKKGWAHKVPSNMPAAAYRYLHRAELARQRDLLQGIWKSLVLMFIPLVLGLFIIPAPILARLELRSMGLATFAFGFLLVWKLNQIAARKLQQRIEALDHLEPRQ
jgi:hypothetical protein